MNRKIAALLVMIPAIFISGCLGITDKCKDVSCEDRCSGSTRLYDGSCSDGGCRYLVEGCRFGCSEGTCEPQLPHLELQDNPQKRGDFTLEFLSIDIETGERDRYDFYLKIENTGSVDTLFSVMSTSIVAETGIMHSTEGFSWSDLMEGGGNRNITFSIRNVPNSLREQNTTLVIRTDHGYYYYKASFEP